MLLVGHGELEPARGIMIFRRVSCFGNDGEIRDELASPAEISCDFDAEIFGMLAASRLQLRVQEEPLPCADEAAFLRRARSKGSAGFSSAMTVPRPFHLTNTVLLCRRFKFGERGDPSSW